MTRMMIAAMIKTNKYNKMAKGPCMKLYRLEHRTKRTPGGAPIFFTCFGYLTSHMEAIIRCKYLPNNYNNKTTPSQKQFSFRNPIPKTINVGDPTSHSQPQDLSRSQFKNHRKTQTSIKISNKTKNQTANTNAFLYYDSK